MVTPMVVDDGKLVVVEFDDNHLWKAVRFHQLQTFNLRYIGQCSTFHVGYRENMLIYY